MNWRKISTVSLWSGFIVFLVHTFLKKYVAQYWKILFALEIILLNIFLFSELMKFTIKIRMKNKTNI